MQRDAAVDTTRRVLQLIDAGTLEWAASPQRLSSAMFFEREQFEKDKALFARQPHVVADTSEEERAMHLQGVEFSGSLLRDEDFVAAAECQQGFESGRDSIVMGSNEPLLQHIHLAWDEAVGIDHRQG